MMSDEQRKMTAGEIAKDLSDRQGLKQVWAQIDHDLQEYIIDRWAEIIRKHEEMAE